jgi:hypothetical protein
MHIVGASAAIWTTTIVLAFYVNPIMDWFKGGPKKNQNPAASSTLSPLRSGKGMSVAGKTIHNVPENGTSWWGNRPRKRTRSQKAGDSHV